jgi:putative DNA primase/helicase|tara:strand:+ start:2040 stop:3233 length:1194 start_codon:yes stop_codon:yes gene_type:complete
MSESTIPSVAKFAREYDDQMDSYLKQDWPDDVELFGSVKNRITEAAKEQLKKPYKTLIIQSLEDVKPKRYEWLWPDMIAKGELHTFAGESGIGKTQLLLRIAATVSNGGTFPGQSEPCQQGKVIYLSGEDSLAHTIKPRLMACGANMANILPLSHTRPDGSQWTLGQEELDELTDYIKDDGTVSLFIIDPVTAFCGNKFDNDSVTDVRRLQVRLRKLIEDTGVACVVLTHLTKNSQNKPIHRILGSGAWTHGPRMVLGAIKDGDRYLFGKWIANIADARSVFPYDMTTQEVEYEDGKHPTVCIDWETPMFDKQLDEFEAFQTSSNQKELVAIDELEDELKNGEWHMKSPLVDRVKSKARCSAKTVERAADQLAAQGLLEKQRTNTTPSKMMWRRPPV